MSVDKICANCGCSAFVSDRSLGGKIVCSKCGSSSFKRSFKKQSFSFFSKKFIFLVIGIAILIIII